MHAFAVDTTTVADHISLWSRDGQSCCFNTAWQPRLPSQCLRYVQSQFHVSLCWGRGRAAVRRTAANPPAPCRSLLRNAWTDVATCSVPATSPAVRGDLIRILTKLLKRKNKFDHILIETTGLADPAPVAQASRHARTAYQRPALRPRQGFSERAHALPAPCIVGPLDRLRVPAFVEPPNPRPTHTPPTHPAPPLPPCSPPCPCRLSSWMRI